MKLFKAAHILHSIEYSGAEIMLFQASGIFSNGNIQTTLVACESKKGKFEEKMLEAGFEIARAGSEGKIKFLINFFNYFRKNKFDVIHIHTEDLYLWKVIALKISGHHNIVRSYHNNWHFEGWLKKKRTIHRKIARILGVKNHAIGLAVEDNERVRFKNPSTIINNWIKLNGELLESKENIRLAQHIKWNIPADSFVIISVGGCSAIKNHAFILDLVRLLDQQGLNITYLHVGTGSDENNEKKLSEITYSNSRVIFTGNSNNVPELLISADLYLMPSLFEGLSIALLEAMYYNGLVVVNDAPGLSNMVEDKINGYVIDVKDKNAYLSLISSLINKDINTDTITKSAKEFVETNFSMEKNAKELIDFYTKSVSE
jgi:glycosyltransferase involved in cell wall biosynthesis